MIRWLDHTADVCLEIVCDRREDLFSEFVTGLRSLLVTGDVRPEVSVPVSLEEPGPEDLLVSLGREILFRFNTDRFVPARFDVDAMDTKHLTGNLWGEPFDAERMAFHLEVKGVTYHDLAVVREGDTWRARITFDV